jgi:predicted alpha/beta superfamily hydrolase
MKKMYFNNLKGWEQVRAVCETEDKMCGSVIDVEEKDSDGYYSFDFDNVKFASLYFSGGIGNRTRKIIPGALSLCIEKKFSKRKGEYLTYLVSRRSTKVGKVDNYTLTDEVNLAYRKDKSKKISIFVPDHYNGETSYDLLYFFDAQNLFSNSGEYTENGDPYGSWQLDIIMDELHTQYGKNIIVVGIDNADEYRSNELFMNPADFGTLTPLARSIPNDNFSVGYLDNLSDFMMNTLHKFVKEHYNIKEDNIGIGGSSMGGIAALYCGIKELGFYKYILSYSPAFGLYSKDSFDNYFRKKDFRENQDILPKIHIYCGEADPLEKKLLPAARGMKWHLTKNGYRKDLVYETYDSEKSHNEEAWRMILPESFTLLFDLE